MLPQNSQISVSFDDTYHVETVDLSLVSNTLCVGYRILRSAISVIPSRSSWVKEWKKRLAVYVLLNDATHCAYIGETEDLLKHLNDHAKKEPCQAWSVALAFCDADGKFLDKGKIKFLEHFAWEAAKHAGTYKLTNSTTPKASHVPSIKATEAFGDYMKALSLPLGVPYLFSPITGTTCSSVSPTSTPSSSTIAASLPFPPSSPPLSSPSVPSPPSMPPSPSAKGSSAGDYSPAVIFAAALSLLGPTLSAKEVSWLQTDAAVTKLLLGHKGLPPLKPHSGANAVFMSSGHTRYFTPLDFVFPYNGTTYRVSSQGKKHHNGTIPTYEWALKHGLSDAQICAECKRLGFKPR